jgi:cell volume regulation protein A
MTEIVDFGLVILVGSGVFALAVLSSKLSERLSVPAPAIFLLAAALGGRAFSGLGDLLSVRDVERIAVVALVMILFDGGMRVGWARFRAAIVPITLLGVVGTFATAALMAFAARAIFGFSWTSAGLLGAAIAPTDPAVMFSVLGRREVGGRSDTILEGESGVNDPVGIALMVGLIELATHEHATFWVVVREFVVEMSVGLAIGVAGALLVIQAVRRIELPNPALYPLRTLAAAGVIYGLAAVAHGSGFIAVFVAGIIFGGARLPHKRDVERFHTSLASLAEIIVFVALGLTINSVRIGTANVWLDALLLALLLVFVARPVVVGPLLLRTHLRAGERLFIMWSGLKGAVPILLAAFALLEGVDDAERIYGIVFVLVGVTVLVHGATIPLAARRFGVPMRLRSGDGE